RTACARAPAPCPPVAAAGASGAGWKGDISWRASLDAGAFERDRRVAALALGPELPEMDVVVAMACRTVGGQAHLSGGLAMAVIAGELRVAAGEREIGLLVVVEIPDLPAIGRVTGCALVAERALVHVAAAVTCDTFLRRARVAARRMALAAADDHV